MWNKKDDEPTNFRPPAEPMRSPAPAPLAPVAAPAAATSATITYLVNEDHMTLQQAVSQVMRVAPAPGK